MRQSIRIDIQPVTVAIAFTVVLLGLSCVCALNIAECNNVEAKTFISTTRPNCDHSFIYCNGQDSQFCDSPTLCDSTYNCDEAITTSSPSSTVAWSLTTIRSSTTGTLTTASTIDVRSLCRHGVTKKYIYPKNCNYYYYCVDGFLVVEQCPIGYAFYEPNGTCSGHIADIVDCKRIIGCCLQLSQAAFLMECEGVIISRVKNPNPECSEYVYCNGDDSYYCNDECTEPVSCYGSNETQTQPPVTAPINTTVVIEEQRTDPRPINTIFTISSNIPSSTTPTTTTPTTTNPTTTNTISCRNLHVICRRSGQDGVYPYPANYNYYYQCISGYLLLQQCPQNFNFDVTQGKCIGTNPYH